MLELKVGVVLSRESFGTASLRALTPPLDVVTADRAFQGDWDSDAHFVTYQVLGPGVQAWPRLKKVSGVLGEIRSKGGEVVTTMVAVDLDTPRHVTWTEDLLKRFEEDLGTACEHEPLVGTFTIGYTSRAGARLVYFLERSVPVERGEDAHAGLVMILARSGLASYLPADPRDKEGRATDRCGDWSRLFRLPRVVRDGTKSWESPFYQLAVQEDSRLDADLLPLDVRRARFPTPPHEIIWGERPSETAARALLVDDRHSPTPWAKEAKRRLRGRKCYGPLFEGELLAESGTRDVTLQSLVGEAAALLSSTTAGTTPELLFALFLDAVLSMEPFEDRDAQEVLWSACQRYHAAEVAKAKAEAQRQRDEEAKAVCDTDKVVHGAREWNKSMSQDLGEALNQMSGLLIACTGSRYYPMCRSGYYDPVGVTLQQLPARIRELGMDRVIQLREPDDRGRMKELHPQRLVDRHGTIVRQVEFTASRKPTHIVGATSEFATLKIRAYERRQDLEPAKVSEVDEWLRHLGGDRYRELCEWIGLAQAWEEGPICALSISGDPGIGKKLLVQGLAECTTSGIVADAKEFGKFQSMLFRTPFLWVNEGMPRIEGTRSPADTFRHLVGGDPMPLERKYDEQIMLRAPIRIIFTANNHKLVENLVGDQDLSPQDRAALSSRIFHFEAGNRAALWLAAQGGQAHTSRDGSRWIGGDAGQPSDNLVARHFLWLYENRPRVPAGARLLMEGSLQGGLVDSMRTRSGAAPEIVEAVAAMVESPDGAMGAVVEGRQIMVTISSVVDYHRRVIRPSTGRRIDSRNVESVLLGLSSSQPRVTVVEKVKGKGRKLAKWFYIDGEVLLREATEHGWLHDKLLKIVRGTEAVEQERTHA